MKKIKIGIDVGITSCGWAILDTDNHIVEHGVRLYDAPENRDGGSYASERRIKRQNRRKIARLKTRKRDLIKVLYESKLFAPNNPKLKNANFAKNSVEIIESFRQEVTTFQKGENFDVYEWRKHFLTNSILDIKGYESEQLKKYFLRSIYWYLHNRGYSHLDEYANSGFKNPDDNSDIKDKKPNKSSNENNKNVDSFYKLIQNLLINQYNRDLNPINKSNGNSINISDINIKNLSNVKYPVDAQLLMRDEIWYPKEFADNKKFQIQLTKTKDLINQYIRREWYINELEKILNANTNFLTNFVSHPDEFKNSILAIFGRQRDFSQGPGSEKSPTNYGLYPLNGVREYKTLSEKLLSKCQVETDERVAPSTSFSYYLFRLFEYCNNLSYGDSQSEEEKFNKLTAQSKIELFKLVFLGDKKTNYLEGTLSDITNTKLLQIFKKQFDNEQLIFENIVGILTEKKKPKDSKIEVDSIKKFPIELGKIKDFFKAFYNAGFKFKKELVFTENFLDDNFDFIYLMDSVSVFFRNYLTPESMAKNLCSNEPLEVVKNPYSTNITFLKAINNVFYTDNFVEAIEKLKNEFGKIGKKRGSKGTTPLSIKFLIENNFHFLKTHDNFSQWRHKYLDVNKVRNKYKITKGCKHLTWSWIKDAPYSATFKRSVKQTIAVINAIFDLCRKNQYEIDVISIELPREWNNSEQRENYRKNSKFWEDLRKQFIEERLNKGEHTNPSFKTLKKFKLWHDQELNGRPIDLYDGKVIDWENIDNYEIDHIIPKSYLLDNSFNNSVLTHKNNNRNKLNQTPKEWMEKSEPGKYERMCNKWRLLYMDPNSKSNNQKKYQFLTFDVEKDLADFLNKNLVDTRAIAYQIKEMLEVYKQVNGGDSENGFKINITNGKATNFLRKYKFFKIDEKRTVNQIIDGSEHYTKKDSDVKSDPKNTTQKNRNWNGHHAHDAVLIAALDSMPLVKKFIQNQEFIKLNNSFKSSQKLKTKFDKTEAWLSNNLLNLAYELRDKRNEIKFSRKVSFLSNTAFHNETLYRGIKDHNNNFYKIQKISILDLKPERNSWFEGNKKPEELVMDESLWSELSKFYKCNVLESNDDSNKKTNASPFQDAINQQNKNTIKQFEFSPLSEDKALLIGNKKIKFIRQKTKKDNINQVLKLENNNENKFPFYESLDWLWIDLYAIDIGKNPQTKFLPVPANTLTIKVLPKGDKSKFNLGDYLTQYAEKNNDDENRLTTNLITKLYENMPKENFSHVNFDYRNGYIDFVLDKLKNKLKMPITNVKFVTRLHRGNTLINTIDHASEPLYVVGFAMVNEKLELKKLQSNSGAEEAKRIQLTISSLLSKHYTKIVHMDVLGNIHKTIDLTKFITKHND